MTVSQSLDAGGRERLLDALLGVLDDPDAKMREHAVRVLATWRERAPLGVVLGALEDPVAEVRAAAIDALTPLIGQVAPARLLALLDDHDHHVRQAARRLVGQAGAPLLACDVPAFFADGRRSGQVSACHAALQMLATLGAAAPIAPLAAALHAPQPAVSAAARDALVAAGRAAQPSLRAALADAQPHVRAYALQGLWQVAEDERPALLDTALHDLPAWPTTVRIIMSSEPICLPGGFPRWRHWSCWSPP